MSWFPTLAETLAAAGVAAWHETLGPLAEARLADRAHGDLPAWRRAVELLPRRHGPPAGLDADTVALLDAPLEGAVRDRVRSALEALAPWRKGPFDVGGIVIDGEWRSDLKWRRLAPVIAPLDGRRVLDVGAGNGYYALRMLGAGAHAVLGVDPTLRHVVQYRALARFLPPLPVEILPFRLEELPARSRAFDTTFSMGVLYHQRSPLEHLLKLRDTLRPGGELVLETLILPGDEAYARTPRERYARMRNVWLLPTLPELRIWVERSGFRDCRTIDVTRTTTDEQRRTEWMTFDSLAEALAPDDPRTTVEGWPAPRRALLLGRAP